jgi:hypothetical protein
MPAEAGMGRREALPGIAPQQAQVRTCGYTATTGVVLAQVHFWQKKGSACMVFKLIVFVGILAVVAVLGMRAYRVSVWGFEARQAPPARCDATDGNAGSGASTR